MVLKGLKRHAEIIIVIFIFSIAFIMRVWGSQFALPVLYNVDEAQMVSAAVRFGTGDLNPHSFIYPSLFKYVLFVAYGIYFIGGSVLGKFSSLIEFRYLYFNDPSVFYHIGRIISALAGSLTVLAVYFLGKKTYSKKVGFIAAIFFSFGSLHLLYSQVALSDVTMVFFATLSLYFMIRVSRERYVKNYVLAGIFGGLAISTKYNGVFLLIPLFVAHFFGIFGDRNRLGPVKQLQIDKLALGYLFVVVFFFVGTPFALLDFRTFLQDLHFQSVVITHSCDSIWAFFSSSASYISKLFLPHTLNWDTNYVGMLAVIGIIFAFFRHTKDDFILLSFVLVHFVFFTYKTSVAFVKSHYMLPIFPFVYVLVARLIVEGIEKIKFDVKKRNYVIAFVVCLFVWPSMRYNVLYHNAKSRKDTTTLAREWIEDNVPPNSKILCTDIHGIGLKENEESLIRYASTEEVAKDKIEARQFYRGKTYFIEYLTPGWGFITDEQAGRLDTLPEGISLVDRDKVSIEYWRNLDFDYAIVMPNRVRIYLSEEGRKKYPHFHKFFRELISEYRAVKEFTPIPLRRLGHVVQIYSLKEKVLTAQQ